MKSVKRMKNQPAALRRWTRMTSAKWEEEWIERLQFLGPGRAAIIGWPGSRSVRIEAFCDEKTGRLLVREFGGKLTKARDWISQPDQPRKPLRIRGRLTLHGDEKSFEAHAGPGTPLLVPAGMAFGSGDHVTTASCLRMLCDASASLRPGWRAIDAGTGSGILAIAAAALGAAEVEAFDFDPACVRIARANARANGSRGVVVAQADVLKWKHAAAAEIVMANLFSDLLIQAAPRLRRATKRGGALIFSGVLRTQLAEVEAAFRKLGFEIERTIVRGKWSAGLCRKA
jgi:ribosomal protein L11 methyltransferase